MLRNLTKEKFNNHLVDIITNKMQVAVTKNTQMRETNWKMIDFQHQQRI